MSDAVLVAVGRVAASAAGRGSTSKRRAGGAYRRHAPVGARDVRVNVRFSDSEFAAVAAAAKVSGQRPASWLGDIGVRVASDAGVSGLVPGAVGVGEDLKVVLVQQQMLAVGRARAQLAAIGNNVNQIARGVNAGQPVESEQAQVMYAHIRTHVDRLDAEVDRLRVVAGH